MALKITDTLMSSDWTPHTAVHDEDGWSVTWLPGRQLSRNQAVSAMTIAEFVSYGLEPDDPRWPHVDGWARELGLTGSDAALQASSGPPEPELEG